MSRTSSGPAITSTALTPVQRRVVPAADDSLTSVTPFAPAHQRAPSNALTASAEESVRVPSTLPLGSLPVERR